MSMAEFVMRKFYRKAAGDPTRLPWHRDAPSPSLVEAVRGRAAPARALDVGCGAGVFSAWLAQQGFEVTGIDLFPEAIAMSQARAAQAGVRVDFVCTDLFAYVAARPYDLVFDSGCLHSLVGGDVASYKQKLLVWLASGGAYVLEHWGKRHALDWRPMGPRRRSQRTIERIFAPELSLLGTQVEDFEVPIPFGPIVRGVGYRFARGATI